MPWKIWERPLIVRIWEHDYFYLKFPVSARFECTVLGIYLLYCYISCYCISYILILPFFYFTCRLININLAGALLLWGWHVIILGTSPVGQFVTHLSRWAPNAGSAHFSSHVRYTLYVLRTFPVQPFFLYFVSL